MSQITNVNHHSAAVFPFHRTEEGIEILFEVKDSKLLPPYFDAGLNALGGNNAPEDKSVNDIFVREAQEEFWLRKEPPGVSFSTILRQEVAESFPQISDHPFPVSDIREAGNLIIRSFLTKGVEWGRDFQMTIPQPILKQPRTYLASVWFTPMSREEFSFIKGLIENYYGILTTDNIRYAKDGHRMATVRILDVNSYPRKFAWGYDHILTNMLRIYGEAIGASQAEQEGVLRPLRLIDCRDLGRQPLGSFRVYEQQGYVYANRQVPATS